MEKETTETVEETTEEIDCSECRWFVSKSFCEYYKKYDDKLYLIECEEFDPW